MCADRLAGFDVAPRSPDEAPAWCSASGADFWAMSRLHFLTPMLRLETIIFSIVSPVLYIINVHTSTLFARATSLVAHALLFPQGVATPVIGAALMPATADVVKLLGFTFQGPDSYRDRYACLLGRATRGLVEMRAHVIRAAVFGFTYVRLSRLVRAARAPRRAAR